MFIFKITHYFKTTITQKNSSLKIIFNIFHSSIFYYITKNALCNHTVHNKFIWRRHPDLNWGIKVLQTSALPLGYAAVWSGKRGSNSRPSPWQGDALPLSYFRIWRFLSAAVSATCIIICITEYFVNNFFEKNLKNFSMPPKAQ